MSCRGLSQRAPIPISNGYSLAGCDVFGNRVDFDLMATK